jgi:hypothetical protein
MNNSFGIVFPANVEAVEPAYGSFSSTQTQNLTQNTPLPFTYDTQDITPVGVSQSGASIVVQRAGVYKVLSSLQCNKTSGGAGDMEFWIGKNGTAVPNSATRIQINANQEVVMAVEWFLDLAASDTLAVIGFSSTTGLQALAVASAGPVPAIPAIITTILRIA